MKVSYYNADVQDYEEYEVETIHQLLDHLDNAHLLMHIEGIGDLMSMSDVAIVKDLSREIRTLLGG